MTTLHTETQPAIDNDEVELIETTELSTSEETVAAVARRQHRGMSLLEIMVVITLIGLVTAAVGVAVMGQLEDGQMKTARNQAFEIEKSLDIYKLQHGTYPSSAQGLGVLASPPKGKAIMERVPKDPWGNDYIYMSPGQKNKKFDIISKGPDQQEGTEDDVGNWDDE
jgi:general secretion pathway protein G